eukprot:2719247-Lingulodinium_polyedra.AAC.1
MAPPPGLQSGQAAVAGALASLGASSSSQHAGPTAPAVRPLTGKPPAPAPGAPASTAAPCAAGVDHQQQVAAS